MSNPDEVNASEIGEFKFCQEAWRIKAGRKQEQGAGEGGGRRAEQKKWWAKLKLYQFCKAVARLRDERKSAELEARRRGRGKGRRGKGRRGEEARERGRKDHAAWRTVGVGLSWIMAWARRGAAGAVGLGAGGLALDQLGEPVNRGLLVDANLVVEVAAALLVSALVVFVETWCWWYRAGFGLGWTLSADDVTLRAPALGLVGKPDRIVLRGGVLIPEEKKPKPDVHDNYIVQLGAYLVLVEDFKKRPLYGFVVLGTGQRHKIKNTEDLRNKVKATAQAIRTARTNLRKPLAGADNPKKCGGCGESKYCTVKAGGA